MNADAIRHFIQNEILNDATIEIGADQDLLLNGTLDSLGVMRLVNFIETEAELQIPPEDVTLENFQSLETISNYLATRQAPP